MLRGKRFLTFAIDKEIEALLGDTRRKLALNQSEIARRGLRVGLEILLEHATLPGSRRIKGREADLPGKGNLNGE